VYCKQPTKNKRKEENGRKCVSREKKHRKKGKVSRVTINMGKIRRKNLSKENTKKTSKNKNDNLKNFERG
jgi:hypothetical protein